MPRSISILIALFAFSFAGCASHQVESSICFHDGVCRDVVTIEQNPSLLNSAVITGVEDPQSRQVETIVQAGTSVGKAMLDTTQTAGMLGMGALIGTGTNSINLNVGLKPVKP